MCLTCGEDREESEDRILLIFLDAVGHHIVIQCSDVAYVRFRIENWVQKEKNGASRRVLSGYAR